MCTGFTIKKSPEKERLTRDLVDFLRYHPDMEFKECVLAFLDSLEKDGVEQNCG